MSAAARALFRPDHGAPNINVLSSRARTYAYLYRYGFGPDLQTYVDRLQDFSIKSGLVQQYGQDLIQQIISNEFANIPRERF
jgi:hypothetical protein